MITFADRTVAAGVVVLQTIALQLEDVNLIMGSVGKMVRVTQDLEAQVQMASAARDTGLALRMNAALSLGFAGPLRNIVMRRIVSLNMGLHAMRTKHLLALIPP